jgi:hypothetical protein
VQQQPQKAPVVTELIDMSVDWVDARNLISYALVDYYASNFTSEGPQLSALLAHPRTWRKLIPLGVAARVVGTDSAHAPAAYLLVQDACRFIGDPNVYDALRYVLRVGGMYGDQRSILAFLSGLQASENEDVRELVCDFIRNPKLRWEHVSRDEVASMLRGWKKGGNGVLDDRCIDEALARLEMAKAG